MLGFSQIELFERMWIQALEFFHYNPALVFSLGATLFSSGIFWIYNSFLLYIDLTGKPKFLQAYKIQDEKEVPIDRTKLFHTVAVVLRNQIINLCVLAAFYPLFRWRGMPWEASKLPTPAWFLVEFAVFLIVEEFGFYYSHRLLHHPKLYKHIHKVHHEWTAPMGIVSIYCHPIENILSNAVPMLLGPLLVCSHAASLWMWITIGSINTSNSHSGYHFPSFPSPEQHDYHHLKFNQCYGVLGILDWLHGTDAQFRASKNYQRHKSSYSFVPVKELYPDDKDYVKTD